MQLCPNCGEENPARFRLCGFCGAPLAADPAPRDVRKTVTIVFSDLKGSTDLGESVDSEALREILARYFDAMRDVLEAHGGRVEKYIGDAIMAVFGLPTVHEDDAIRAVRAAAEMKRTLASLNHELEERWGVTLTNRTGVNTGEVVAGDPTLGQRLVTGDAVNVAARLEQAAPGLEVLIGEPTYRLVRDAVEVRPVEPLELKGKSQRVAAYLLLAAKGAEEVERAHRTALVGRDADLRALADDFERAASDHSSRLATVVADAGVGKSRLLEEFARSLGDRAQIVRGRCLPYGRGITFWPLVEIVRQATGVSEEDSLDVAYARLVEVAGDGGAEIAERVGSVVGLAPGDFPINEVFWATRRLFETLAATRPVVAVFEDIHWAETTLLDLVEFLAGGTTSSPILIICAARPTLAEIRPTWRDVPGNRILELGPLSDEHSAMIVDELLGDAALDDAVRVRILAAAEGNPLYVEQLLSMLIEDGVLLKEDGRWTGGGDISELQIPPTIHALLEARLDLLSRNERSVIESAAVIGLYFAHEAVDVLVSDPVRSQLHDELASLCRKQLIRGEDGGFRFQHILVRDAAYQGLLKRTRATLHARFADWAERINTERETEPQFEEIVAYHLEQAYLYLSELGPLDEEGRTLGDRAAVRLSSAGRRAFGRGDMTAAANLLRRAASIMPSDEPDRIELLPLLSEALMETGEFAWADVYLNEAREAAARSGDVRLEADVVLTGLLVRHHVTEDLYAWRAEVQREAERLIPLLEARAAHRELAKAWRMLGFVHGSVCRFGDQVAAVERAIEHARLANDARLEARLAAAYTIGLMCGPTPVPEAIARCEEILGTALADRQAEALALCSLSCLCAMDGDFDEARRLQARGRSYLADLGATVLTALAAAAGARIELLASDPERAEAEVRQVYETLGSLGERYFRPAVGAYLAEALYRQGRHEEAASTISSVKDVADPDDVETQVVWRLVQARILARMGEKETAVALAREAVHLSESTDYLIIQADAKLALAEVIAAEEDPDAIHELVEAARALYEGKGSSVAAGRAGAVFTRL